MPVRREPSFLLTAIANSLLLFVITNSFGYAGAAGTLLDYVLDAWRFWVGATLGIVMVMAGLWSAWTSCGWKFGKKLKLSVTASGLTVGTLIAIGTPSRSIFSYGARDFYFIALYFLGLAIVSTLVLAPFWAVFGLVRKRQLNKRDALVNASEVSIVEVSQSVQSESVPLVVEVKS